MTTTTEQPNKASIRPPVRRDATPPARRPFVSHVEHLRELTMADGRQLLLDRRSIAFLCQAKPDEFDGKAVCIIAFKGWAKPCPVVEAYADLKAWWRGGGEEPGQ
jgi:hypothetical protein